MSQRQLPSHINTANQEYHLNMRRFCQWLGQAAQATGTVNRLFETRPLSNLGNITTIQLDSFVPLSEAIINDQTAQVPYKAFTHLDRAISGRTDVNRFYVANYNSSKEDKESNKRHQHVIDVLKGVREILRAKQINPTRTSTTETTQASTVNSPTSNFFGKLQDLDDSLSATSFTSSAAESDSTIYMLDEDDEMESQYQQRSSAAIDFLKKATTIRLFVKSTWQEFKSGRITLQTAAFTANAAIAKIEELSNKFQLENASDMDYRRTVEFITGEFCTVEVCKKCKHGPTKPKLAYDHDGQQLSGDAMICKHITRLVSSFMEPGMNQDERSPDEKKLLKCLCQLLAVGTVRGEDGECQPFFGDLIHKATCQLFLNHQFDPWIIFAIQILWDTHEALGETAQNGERMLIEISDSVNERYQHYIDTPGVGLHYSGRLSEMVFRNRLWTHGRIQSEINKAEPRMCAKTNSFQDIPGFSLFRYHPGLCGLVAGRILFRFHDFGLAIAGREARILMVAHLYNALRQRRLLPNTDRWEDIEWFIEKQSNDCIFAGKARPTKTNDIIARLQKVFDSTAEGPPQFNYIATQGKTQGALPRWGTQVRLDLSCNIAAIVDVLGSNERGSLVKYDKLGHVNKLIYFRKALEKDSFVLGFDFMALDARCLKFLQHIQTFCFQNHPDEYPEEVYEGHLSEVDIVKAIFASTSWVEKPVLYDAAMFLQNLIRDEGKFEGTRAEEIRVMSLCE